MPTGPICASGDELDVWPEFLQHNAMGPRYWARLRDAEHPAFQLAFLDGTSSWPSCTRSRSPGAAGSTTRRGLGDAFLRAFESGRAPDALSAVAIAVRPDRGPRPGAAALDAMCGAGREAGLRDLIAPVRPTLKRGTR
jgi:hypothetical protein